MKVAIIDADLVGRKKHRFPNLACMKLSGYYKSNGYDVTLKTDYNNLDQYDKVFISKVFTDTYIDEKFLELENVEYGGTGFFYDKAPNLPDEIEHHMPDYHLYDNWIQEKLQEINKKTGKPKYRRDEFKEYFDCSIGYLTRGCFRKCQFCVNQKYDHVFKHSPLKEFYDPSRKKICLLDDNFFGYKDWKPILQELIDTNKKIKFKQGLDERILTDEKCKMLFSAKYDSDYTFAFDNIEDYDIINNKLQLIRKYTDKLIVFYVLCAFQRERDYDEQFWKQDIENVFKRIELLFQYKCVPYIMRYEKYKDSPYKGMYITLARWCNQFSFVKKNSFREYCRDVKTNGIKSSAYRYMTEFESQYPEIAEKYFDMKFGDQTYELL